MMKVLCGDLGGHVAVNEETESMARRKIVEIDEHKCNGCGLCVPACAEGAIRIVDGKARLVSDVYCDGLGACLGECPEGAIRIVEREAEAFDEEAARRHVAGEKPRLASACAGGCPGTAARDLRLNVLSAPGVATARRPAASQAAAGAEPSALGNWPIQLHLVPPHAPFLKGRDLLLVADCVPFALADFHRRMLPGRPVVIGCPKLDDVHAHVDKLAGVLATASPTSLTVVHMEVPCCTGLLRIAEAALARSGADVPLDEITVSIRGEVLAPS